jgi:3-hydroxyacyl-CoA dehydrogenase
MISKVAVIGSGTMGSGIAAQLANADIEVLLLDIKGEDEQPNAIAERAVERIRKSSPPLIVHPDVLHKIRTGNIEDNLAQVADCDWIVEAIVERLELKKQLYRNIEEYRKEGAIVSSNTSTIPMTLLVEGMPASFRSHFAITHFFNPVRYMRLLELVEGNDTATEVMDELRRFNAEKMGKGIVDCRDTPGFLANRVGVFALQVGIDEAFRCGISVEEADALMGRPMGIPKTGVFGLYDLIGLDLMVDVARSLESILPAGDAFHQVSGANPLITRLIDEGYTGLKGNGGFYRMKEGQKEVVGLADGKWGAVTKATCRLAAAGEEHGTGVLIDGDTAQHRFCRRVLARVLAYAAGLIPEVADNPVPIDDAMKLGYNWLRGPFELIDDIGPAEFTRLLESEGVPVPAYLCGPGQQPCYRVRQHMLEKRHVDNEYKPLLRAPGVIRFSEARRTLEPVAENDSASLFKLEGDIGMIEFHTKANALDGGSMQIVAEAAARAGSEFRGLVVHNDGPQFSAGVNLNRFRELIENDDWVGIDSFLKDFQDAVRALKYCPVPVVAAPSGLTIGGGYEVVAHCDVMVAHTNIVLGLVESLVGVVPGGGGVKDTLHRWHQILGDWEQAAHKTFTNIAYGKTGTSPQQAAELAYFRPEVDYQVMNRDRLLASACEVIGRLSKNYSPPAPPLFHWCGKAPFDAMSQLLKKMQQGGRLRPHDVIVGTELARIVTGGEIESRDGVGEDEMYEAERKAFITLAKTDATRARISHMLDRGSRLRN